MHLSTHPNPRPIHNVANQVRSELSSLGVACLVNVKHDHSEGSWISVTLEDYSTSDVVSFALKRLGACKNWEGIDGVRVYGLSGARLVVQAPGVLDRSF